MLCRIGGGPARDVYIMLAHMERLGWVAGEPDPDRPARFAGDPSLPRSFYHLTPEGRQAGLRLLGLKDDGRVSVSWHFFSACPWPSRTSHGLAAGSPRVRLMVVPPSTGSSSGVLRPAACRVSSCQGLRRRPCRSARRTAQFRISEGSLPASWSRVRRTGRSFRDRPGRDGGGRGVTRAAGRGRERRCRRCTARWRRRLNAAGGPGLRHAPSSATGAAFTGRPGRETAVKPS